MVMYDVEELEGYWRVYISSSTQKFKLVRELEKYLEELNAKD